jgi:hypothetical protein
LPVAVFTARYPFDENSSQFTDVAVPFAYLNDGRATPPLHMFELVLVEQKQQRAES